MAKIGEIDKNLKVETDISGEDMIFFDAKREPFELFGLSCKEQYGYKRMPDDVAKSVNEGVFALYRNTSGIRVAFETDSSCVAIQVKVSATEHLPHMPMTGVSGFDMYTDEGEGFTYCATFTPPLDATNGYESKREFKEKKSRRIIINFPLYNNVDELYIGLDKQAHLDTCNPYIDLKPIVFYGSSITQGGCASRPGNNYPAIISRETNTDFVCLGFSGSAHGEQEMAQYIASLPMSILIMDYDYNSEAQELSERHFDFYKTIREKNPSLPIVMVTAPNFDSYKEELSRRREIIFESYNKALKNEDKNVYFIDGETLFGKKYRDCATVDGCHPNDFGFVNMAEKIGNVIKEIIAKI